MSAPEETREVFDTWARTGRADGMERSHGPAARAAFDELPLTPESWYLDIGCGNGYSVRWAADICTRGRAYGIDVAPDMIATARRLSAGYDNVEFLHADFTTDDLPAGRLDAVFSMEAFYYLEDIDGALEYVRTLLRPGGHFACVVNFYAENTASHTWPREVGLHMRLLSALGWKKKFERAGLTVVDQKRIKLPVDDVKEEWQTKQGSLFTLGRR